jgi:uncharacterized protein YndB with AHSA1/START domain
MKLESLMTHRLELQIPIPHTRIFQALCDPILLAVWLGAPSVTTGFERHHVFEVMDWSSENPWKVRGEIEGCKQDALFVVQTDTFWKQQQGHLWIELEGDGAECCFKLKWDTPVFAPLAKALVAPGGITRLKSTLSFKSLSEAHHSTDLSTEGITGVPSVPLPHPEIISPSEPDSGLG